MLLSDYFFEERSGIKLLRLNKPQECEESARKLIYANTDPKTILFLSGGSTPKKLYEEFAKDKSLSVGAVGMVDERYSSKWHETSNEKMIRETGLLEYLDSEKVSFYPILHDQKIEKETEDYDETLHYLFSYFPKSIAILGIGADGHTAGVPAVAQISRRIINEPSALVTNFNEPKKYGERITMTFIALSQIDILLILALGTEKREALRAMFAPGPIEEIPARFYLKPEIAKKTILITDQRI